MKWLDLTDNSLNESEKSKQKESLSNLDVFWEVMKEETKVAEATNRVKKFFKNHFNSNEKSTTPKSQPRLPIEKDSILARNLLRNSCGEDDFDFWLCKSMINYALDESELKRLVKLHKTRDTSNLNDRDWQIETEQNGA